MNYKKALAEACSKFEENVDGVLKEVFTKLVVPACKLHGLEFASSMGTYSFYGPEPGVSCVYDCDAIELYGLFGLDEVLEVLALEVAPTGDALGTWVNRSYRLTSREDKELAEEKAKFRTDYLEALYDETEAPSVENLSPEAQTYARQWVRNREE